MGQVTVIVTEAGAGLKFMTSSRKALPPAKAGDVIDIMGGAYAQNCIDDGTVQPAGKMESAPEFKGGGTAVPLEPETAVEPDDFTKIKGIGKSTAAALIAAGINTYAELAAADAEKLSGAISGSTDKIIEWQQAAARLQESD